MIILDHIWVKTQFRLFPTYAVFSLWQMKLKFKKFGYFSPVTKLKYLFEYFTWFVNSVNSHQCKFAYLPLPSKEEQTFEMETPGGVCHLLSLEGGKGWCSKLPKNKENIFIFQLLQAVQWNCFYHPPQFSKN